MENQLLGYLLTDESVFFDFINKLGGLSFGHIDWVLINWVKEFYKYKGRLPTWDELKVKYPVLPDRTNLDIAFVKEEIAHNIREEKLKAFIIRVAADVDRKSVDYDRVFGELKRLRDELDFRLDEGSNASQRYKEILEAVSTPEINERIPTGIKSLDKVLGGGVGRGEITVLIAPPGIGKTTWLLQCMYAALLNRKNVLFITCELSEERLLERLYRRIAKSSREDIRLHLDKILPVLDKFFRFIKAKGTILYKKPYFWTDEDIALQLDKLRSKGENIDMICVDYLDKLNVKRGDFRIGLRDMTENLRYLAIDRNVAMVTATQANRAALSAPMITEEHVSESFGKVEVSDVVLSLGRTLKDEQNKTGKFVILKNREGPGRGVIVPVKMDLDRATIEELL